MVALATAVAAGCSADHRQPTCPRNQPAFRLQLTAPEGARLPADTRLTVGYGGRQESYSLMHGGPMNTDVCCRTGDPVKGRLPDVHCGLPPAPSSSGPPRVRDASLPAPPDAAATPARDGATSPTRDATPWTGRDGALSIRDAAVRSPGDAAVPDAFASRGDATIDAAPPGPIALLCDLWTNGWADVRIVASGYPDFEHEPFDPNVPDPRCGVVPVDLRIELGHADAGVSP